MASGYDQGYYATYYPNWGESAASIRYLAACLEARQLRGRSAKRVLDFGAGLGTVLASIDATERVAVDVSDQSHHACRERGFHWYPALDAVPGRFDLILAIHSLEHTPDPAAILRALKARLAPNGQFVCVVPVETNLSPGPLSEITGHQHLFAWTPETLKNLLLTTGWSLTSVDLVNGRLFHRTTGLLAIHPPLYRLTRALINATLPGKPMEIVAWCNSAAD